eukprot:7334298-Lingulodinium_polyedra.AAC.1
MNLWGKRNPRNTPEKLHAHIAKKEITRHDKRSDPNLCRNVEKTGNCKYGGKCNFTHNENAKKKHKKTKRKIIKNGANNYRGICKYSPPKNLRKR